MYMYGTLSNARTLTLVWANSPDQTIHQQILTIGTLARKQKSFAILFRVVLLHIVNMNRYSKTSKRA